MSAPAGISCYVSLAIKLSSFARLDSHSTRFPCSERGFVLAMRELKSGGAAMDSRVQVFALRENAS